MTILRSGATDKYSQNWASAFGAKKSSSVKAVTKVATKGTAKKTAKSKTAKAGKK